MNRYWVIGTFIVLLVALSICLSPANLHCAIMSTCMEQVSGAIVLPAVAFLGVGVLFFLGMKRNQFRYHFHHSQQDTFFVDWPHKSRRTNNLRLSIRVFLL